MEGRSRSFRRCRAELGAAPWTVRPCPCFPRPRCAGTPGGSYTPETLVVSGELGFGRDYRLYPYGDYEDINNPETLFLNEEIDPRRPPKERLLGIPRDDGFGMAFPFTLLEAMGNKAVVHDDVQGTRSLVVFWSTEGQSAVAFKPTVNGQALTFEVRDDKFSDVETGTEWTMAGRAVSGPLAGSVLEPIHDAYVAFWFAWATFHPNTGLLE